MLFKPYKKKPIVINAVKLLHNNVGPVSEWLQAEGCKVRTYSTPPMRSITGITLVSTEGSFDVPFGHWIIRGVKGEYYPCSDEVMQNNHEDVPSGE